VALAATKLVFGHNRGPCATMSLRHNIVNLVDLGRFGLLPPRQASKITRIVIKCSMQGRRE
jgi:hypothetical protein